MWYMGHAQAVYAGVSKSMCTSEEVCDSVWECAEKIDRRMAKTSFWTVVCYELKFDRNTTDWKKLNHAQKVPKGSER